MGPEFITTLLVNTAVFSVLFVVMILVRLILAERLSAALRYMLWAVVAVKLLIPFGFESPWNFPAWTDVRAQEPKTLVETSSPAAASYDIPTFQTDENILMWTADWNTALEIQDEIKPVQITVTSQQQRAISVHWASWALILWGAGAAVVAVWLLKGAVRLHRRIRRGSRDVPQVYADVLVGCCRELGIRRAIDVCFMPGNTVPAIMGILHPTLLLPGSLREADARELRPILLHELTHYRHGDLWVMGLQNVLTVVYWFNPLTWCCFALMRRDMETLCDQRVLRLLDGERERYIHTILSYTAQGGGERFRAALGLSDGHVRLERRIREMFRRQRSNRRTRMTAALLAAVMLAAGLLTACQQTPGESAVQRKDGDRLEDMIAATANAQQTDTSDHYTNTFTGAEDTVTFLVDADVTRQGSMLPVVGVKPYAIPMDQVRAMAEVLFQGNTAYEPQVTLTKDDIDLKIVEIRQYINDNPNMGDEQKRCTNSTSPIIRNNTPTLPIP